MFACDDMHAYLWSELDESKMMNRILDPGSWKEGDRDYIESLFLSLFPSRLRSYYSSKCDGVVYDYLPLVTLIRVLANNPDPLLNALPPRVGVP